MASVTEKPRHSKPGEPIWELARLYPPQGAWTEEEYLGLETNRLVEYDKGTLEILPMPTKLHQQVVIRLLEFFRAWTALNRGIVYIAPMPLYVRRKQYREPDLMLLLDPSKDTGSDFFVRKADVVVEVVSEGERNRKRDYEAKRVEYQRAGIPEYWIVDPLQKRITVLTLKDGEYVEHAQVGLNGNAASALLNGFEVYVSDLFQS